MSSLSETEISNKKLVAGLTGIFLGAFGVHKFILGYTKPAVIMLVASLLTCGVGYFVFQVIYISVFQHRFYFLYIFRFLFWYVVTKLV